MKNVIRLLMTGILVLSMSTVVFSMGPKPEPPVDITVYFTAEVSYVDDPGATLENSIHVGDFITGEYRYNIETVDSNNIETVGDYQHTESPYGITVNAGGFVFQTNPDDTEFLLEIVNDHGATPRDNFLLRSYKNLPLSNEALVEHISWQLDDPSCSAISSIDMSASPPVLADWESTFGLSITGGKPEVEFPYDQEYFIRAHVVSIETL